MAGYVLILIAVAVLFFFILVFSMFRRYKRCPSDKILVVFGKVGSGKEGVRTAKCIHGGAAFIWPIIQDYSFIDLTPISPGKPHQCVELQNIRVTFHRVTVGISTEPAVMQNAAERLLGCNKGAL